MEYVLTLSSIVLVMQLLAVNEKIRILALTATPGCKFSSQAV